MDEFESILWKTKRATDYSYRKKYSLNTAQQISNSKDTSSGDKIVLPSVSMMTLKQRETKPRPRHHRDHNYGNRLLHSYHESFSQSCSNTVNGNVYQDEIDLLPIKNRNHGSHSNGKLNVNQSFLSNHSYNKLNHSHNQLSNRNYGNINGYDKLIDMQNYGNQSCHDNYYGNLIDYIKHHSNRCYGDRMNNQIYLGDSLMSSIPIGVQGQRVCSDEKEMVVNYRLEKEKEKDNKILTNNETLFRTKSRRREALSSRELDKRLVKKGVSLPSPPLITNCTPKEERERFRPSLVHESYKSFKEFEERKCCRVDDSKPTRDSGERKKRYVHVYLCCCKDR